ncbi:MAG: hypothetical protein J7M29_07405, partial [Verrucomicrobia bacterium]|nr:hypothetical protein [Verrucomicrobiota bacterium]
MSTEKALPRRAFLKTVSAAARYRPLRAPLTIPKVPRDKVICFCLYTVHRGVLKLTAQLYPLKPGESRKVFLEVSRSGTKWERAAEAAVNPEGWMATFRVEGWDESRDYRYRVKHPGGAVYEGTVRRNPLDKDEIVVAVFTGNSNSDRGPRPDIVANIKAQDPDLLFFSGDQSYDHRRHTAAWLLFGRQFGEIIKDRPTITIPDDHDVGQGNLWGEAGGVAKAPGAADGGYVMPPSYVNMVQRAQTSHLPDPYDPAPVRNGITVYYTSLNVGGVDFAIIEDRKWKTGPLGLIPKMGPRPDHITDPHYDPQRLDVPEAELLGKRQLKFLHEWGQDWTDAEMKCVLSQTIFAGAAHLHGNIRYRLMADLDSNGWPQSGRRRALEEIRRCFALMLGGDQHLATVIHHGINDWEDAGWSFCCPSIWNYYTRWWQPLEKPINHDPKNPLPWTGRYYDGFRNKITMRAYANPTPENYRAAGYGLVRFRKSTRTILIECWPRFVDATKPNAKQYPGWPVTVAQTDNYARKPMGWLPTIRVRGRKDPVIQVVDEYNGEIVYTLRIKGDSFDPKIFREGSYT